MISNDNGLIDAGEDRIGGVVIELFDADGNKIAETRNRCGRQILFQRSLSRANIASRKHSRLDISTDKDSLGSVISPTRRVVVGRGNGQR